MRYDPVQDQKDMETIDEQLKELKPKRFGIYLKSYTAAPDYEDEVEAATKAEAVEIFLDKLGDYGWSRDMIESYVEEVK